jgi:hypothetical protein
MASTFVKLRASQPRLTVPAPRKTPLLPSLCAQVPPANGELRRGLKKADLRCCGNANAGIFDVELDRDVSLGFPCDADPHHHLPFFRELDRVANEIGENLLQSPWIAE